MADSEEQLKRMVMTFRVSELQMLLGYAGKNKTGRKSELQTRALDIVKMRNIQIHQKIKELYKSIQLEMMSFGGAQAGAAGMLPNQRVPSALTSINPNYVQSGSMGVNANPTAYSSRSQTSAMGYSSLQAGHAGNSYPISPDVNLKKLPFYDILGELLKPSTLAPHGSGRYQEANFNFSLTPQQANKIAHSRDLRPGKQDYAIQVQMRFCLLETTCEQEDNFPPSITVKINDKLCPLPSPIPTNKQGVEPKRPPRPVNVTALCKISPTVSNRILVSWSSDYGRCYVISVYLVQKLTSEDLLSRLKAKGARLADFTRSLIKQKLREDGECEIATTSLRCSLMCPLGKMRMILPSRAETCIHLQCFDASLFLLMNERKPTWTCPVCDKVAIYDTLVIDGYFQEILQENNSCSEVTLHKDGEWTPLVPKKEKQEQQIEKKKVAVETLIDDSDDSDSESGTQVEKPTEEEASNKRKNTDVECITLSDSDDDANPPPAKRVAYNSSPSNDIKPTSMSDNDASNTGECSKSNDSWCVGEFDPGKRLIFRKSLSNSTTTPVNDNGTAGGPSSPVSSGSPQVICLDSPSCSPSPPLPTQQSSSPLTEINNITGPSTNNNSSTSSTSTYTALHSSQNTNNGGDFPSQTLRSPPLNLLENEMPLEGYSTGIASIPQDPLATYPVIPPQMVNNPYNVIGQLDQQASAYNVDNGTNNSHSYGSFDEYLPP